MKIKSVVLLRLYVMRGILCNIVISGWYLKQLISYLLSIYYIEGIEEITYSN